MCSEPRGILMSVPIVTLVGDRAMSVEKIVIAEGTITSWGKDRLAIYILSKYVPILRQYKGRRVLVHIYIVSPEIPEIPLEEKPETKESKEETTEKK